LILRYPNINKCTELMAGCSLPIVRTAEQVDSWSFV
jgi:hypothetical protein